MPKAVRVCLLALVIANIAFCAFVLRPRDREEGDSLPRILHIAARNETVDLDHLPAWRRLYPSWSIRIWTDAAIREFVEAHDPARLPVMERLVGAKKSDWFRIYILVVMGGVYVDSDVEPVASFAPYLAAHPAPCYFTQESDLHKVAIYRVPPKEVLPCNYMLAALPGNAEFARLRSVIEKLNATQLAAADATEQTGPRLFLRELPRLGNCHILPAWKFGGISSPDNANIPLTCSNVSLLKTVRVVRNLCCSSMERWKLRVPIEALRVCKRAGEVALPVDQSGAYVIHHWRNSWSTDTFV